MADKVDLDSSILSTTKAYEGEIIKCEDLQYAYDSSINNLNLGLKALVSGSDRNFIIGGEVTKEDSGAGDNWNLKIAPILAYHCASHTMIVKHTASSLAITYDGGGYYIVEVRPSNDNDEDVTPCANASRMFNDPTTGKKEPQDIATKRQIQLIARCVKAPADAAEDANGNVFHKEWIKIAEVYIPANATTVMDSKVVILNVTARTQGSWYKDANGEDRQDVCGHIKMIDGNTGADGGEKSNDGGFKDGWATEGNGWQSGNDRTFRPQYYVDQVERFLTCHRWNGDHRNVIIKRRHIEFTTDPVLGVNSSCIPVGDGEDNKVAGVPHLHGINEGEGFPNDNSTLAVIQEIARNINNLYPFSNDLLSRYSVDSTPVTDVIEGADGLEELKKKVSGCYLLTGLADKTKNGIYKGADGQYSWWNGNGVGAKAYVNKLFAIDHTNIVMVDGKGRADEVWYCPYDEETLKDNGGKLDFRCSDRSAGSYFNTLVMRDGVGVAQFEARKNREDKDVARWIDCETARQLAMYACVPIGFIYVQLPGMPAPGELWPWASWENITAKHPTTIGIGVDPFIHNEGNSGVNHTTSATVWRRVACQGDDGRVEGTKEYLKIHGPYATMAAVFADSNIKPGYLFLLSAVDGNYKPGIYLRTTVAAGTTDGSGVTYNALYVMGLESNVQVLKGDTGEKGATGAAGAKGDKGEPGPQGIKGDTGAPAGFGAITATVDNTVGTPAVSVMATGADSAKDIAFAFTGLKGERGEADKIGAVNASYSEDGGAPGVTATVAGGTEKVISLNFSNLKGATGDAAGFGALGAAVDNTVGTPSVSVVATGDDSAKELFFNFTGLKGERGERGEGFTITWEFLSVEEMQSVSAASLETGQYAKITGSDDDNTKVYQWTGTEWHYICKLQGPAAGFGTITATVDDTVGTPAVAVATSGEDTAKDINFAFTGLKGAKGDKGDNGDPATNIITGVKGAAETDYRTGDVSLSAANVGALPISGGEMTGALTLSGNPTDANHAATKGYVDANIKVQGVKGAAEADYRTGQVNLSAEDVGAAAADHTHAYAALMEKPTIGNGTVTIKQNNVVKGSFTTNQSGDTIISIADRLVKGDKNTGYKTADYVSLGPADIGALSTSGGTVTGDVYVMSGGSTASLYVGEDDSGAEVRGELCIGGSDDAADDGVGAILHFGDTNCAYIREGNKPMGESGGNHDSLFIHGNNGVTLSNNTCGSHPAISGYLEGTTLYLFIMA